MRADKRYVEISSLALQGMNQAETRLEGVARRVAGAGDPTDSVDLSSEMVALLESRNAFTANARVASLGDQLQKNVIDLLA